MKAKNMLDQMVYLIYWYGSKNESDCYGFISKSSCYLYQQEGSKGAITSSNKRTLSTFEKGTLRMYQEVEEDLLKEPNDRKRGVVSFREEYEKPSFDDLDDTDVEDLLSGSLSGGTDCDSSDGNMSSKSMSNDDKKRRRIGRTTTVAKKKKPKNTTNMRNMRSKKLLSSPPLAPPLTPICDSAATVLEDEDFRKCEEQYAHFMGKWKATIEERNVNGLRRMQVKARIVAINYFPSLMNKDDLDNCFAVTNQILKDSNESMA